MRNQPRTLLSGQWNIILYCQTHFIAYFRKYGMQVTRKLRWQYVDVIRIGCDFSAQRVGYLQYLKVGTSKSCFPLSQNATHVIQGFFIRNVCIWSLSEFLNELCATDHHYPLVQSRDFEYAWLKLLILISTRYCLTTMYLRVRSLLEATNPHQRGTSGCQYMITMEKRGRRSE